MASETFNLAILLSLKDLASGGLVRAEAQLRSFGKEGRKSLETLDDLRNQMNKGLALGGVGLGGLALIGKGVQVAGNFQASMTDLRTTLSQVGADGKVNFTQLGADMQKAEAIAMKLGNALPGSTEDFVQMIQVLKQNGLQAETILNGAAEAVGNLAVANNALPKDVAKDFAQFGQLFKLKPDEYLKAADVFSKLYTSSGIATDELIQAAKYFQGRSGAAIGLTGLKDAEESIRLIGLLRKQGLEGSEAGTALNNFFSGYISHDKALDALQKDKGIKLKFFDEKGSFAGIDNLFKQLEPLNKLTEEERVIRLKAIFGEEGMAAATAILKTGADGWRSYNAEQSKTISLQQKNAEKAKDFNNQMEALKGSVKNLVVTGFEPLLPSLTSGVDSMNKLVGSIQGFAKENPSLTGMVANLALYGSTAMVVVGGFKAMTSAWRIFKITSAVSSGGGLLQYLNQTQVAANGASTSLTQATTKAKGFKGTLSSIAGSSALKIGVQVVGIAAAETALTGLVQMWSEAAEKNRQMLDNAKELRGQYDSLMGQYKLWNAPGDYGGAKGQFDAGADKILEAMNRSGDLQWALNPERFQGTDYLWETFTNPTPYGMTPQQSQLGGVQFSPESAANQWKQAGITTAIHDPNMLARLVSKIESGGGDSNFNQEGIGLLKQALQQIVGKDKMDIASEILRKEREGDKPQSAAPQTPFSQLFNQLGQPPLFPQPATRFTNPFKTEPVNQAFKPPVQPSFVSFQGAGLNRPSQVDPKFKEFPMPVDLNKPVASLTTSLTGLNQPIAGATQTFTGLQTAGGDWQTSMLAMSQNTGTTATDLKTFGTSLLETKTPLGGLVNSANGVVIGLNSVSGKLANWQPPIPQITTYSIGVPPGTTGAPIVGVVPPSKASGGTVKRDGLVYVHAGEDIMPADVTSRYRSPKTLNVDGILQSARTQPTESKSVTVNYSPQMTVNNASPTAQKDFQAMLDNHSKHIGRLVAEELQNGRVRA